MVRAVGAPIQRSDGSPEEMPRIDAVSFRLCPHAMARELNSRLHTCILEERRILAGMHRMEKKKEREGVCRAPRTKYMAVVACKFRPARQSGSQLGGHGLALPDEILGAAGRKRVIDDVTRHQISLGPPNRAMGGPIAALTGDALIH